jgi:hypothetical protein
MQAGGRGIVNKVPDRLLAKIRAACALGIPAKVISQAAGVPLGTVKGWRRGEKSDRGDVPADPTFKHCFEALFR